MKRKRNDGQQIMKRERRRVYRKKNISEDEVKGRKREGGGTKVTWR